MLRVTRRRRAALGLVGVFAASGVAAVTLLAAGTVAAGIVITSVPCSGGGTEFCFTPEATTVQTGVSVTWTDQTGVAHEIAPCTPSACPGSSANTGTNAFDVAIPPDGHGSFTFTSPGTYYYYCTIHGYTAMHGSITVTSAATPPPSPRPTPTARPTARPTHGPSMQPATPTARVTPAVQSPQPATPHATLPAATPTPAVTQPAASAGSSPSAPAPASPAIAVAASSGTPALPIALVVVVVIAVAASAFVAFWRNR